MTVREILDEVLQNSLDLDTELHFKMTRPKKADIELEPDTIRGTRKGIFIELYDVDPQATADADLEASEEKEVEQP